MSTLDKTAADYVVSRTRRFRDSGLLIDFLQGEREITPAMRLLLVDILMGRLKVAPRFTHLKLSKTTARLQVNLFRSMLTGESGHTGPQIRQLLKAIGYEGIPETKGEITRAAELAVRTVQGLTKSQLDEILRPRSARKKA